MMSCSTFVWGVYLSVVVVVCVTFVGFFFSLFLLLILTSCAIVLHLSALDR